ncbi:NapC/NirT family cytochrome c [Geomonas sp. RF6]|uniref:NapC/NirT family cytochrome c n=1 Tax=Geomonas sp. RF6 TaxID=2897342 RepID=UPI001E425585|nr:NapC/NirT family cytochrome c [Geomonas sp. RF6]UFS68782.1 NapC/NirT family cytochrome c [Geomonas sp. RF6]
MPLRKYAGYAWNLISLFGMVIAITAAGLIIAFLSFEAIIGMEKPYLGLLTYFLFPGMLILGLLLVPLGAYRVREKRRAIPEEDILPFPQVDFNDPHKRRLFIFFVLATIVFLLIVSVASIKGYEFTESTTFCGELCHTVMEPEHTAWSNSPHAKVKCVECHVGPGAEWYVKAKISGLRQLVAVALHTYSRPIETPIANLRPARDTCEHCHWPEKFYFGRQKVFAHYAPNEENTPREIDMLLKIGGTPGTAHNKGIHWHIGSVVNYIATDRKRIEIPYVAVHGADGKVVEYLDTEKPLTRQQIDKAEKRTMDCIDCHNRPTHIYRAPGTEMDEAFMAGRIDRGIPYVKKVAVGLLTRPYKSREEAQQAIAAGMQEYYAKNYPQILQTKGAAVQQAIAQVQEMYAKNFFPRMNVAWNTYPNFIGHFYTPGCFRCHDGKHKSADGRVISKDCNICHVVLAQKQENIPAGTKVNAFVHPVDIGDEIMKTNCSECHSAGGQDVPGGESHAAR